MEIKLTKHELRVNFNGEAITIIAYINGYDLNFRHGDVYITGRGKNRNRDFCVSLKDIKKIKVAGKWKKVLKTEQFIDIVLIHI